VSGGKKVWKNYIGGKWVDSSNKATFDVSDPATGRLIGKVPKSTKDDVEKAIQSAWNTRSVMANMPMVERVEMLARLSELIEKHQKDFIDVIVKEAGKPLSVVQGEVKATIERLKFAIEEVKTMRGEYIPGDAVPDTKGKFAIVKRMPRGVVLAIGPFNYPLFIPTSKIAPALASGNSVVFKAASDDPICMIMFARLAELAGVPPGAFNVITGSGSEIGDYMVSHPRVGMISFTGSSAAGKHITTVAGMKRLHLELGGKCPGVVFEDCDIDLAIKECAKGSLKYSGQRCDSLSRIIVQDKIYNKFARLMRLEAKNWKMGPTSSSKTKIGPLINQGAAERVEGLIQDAIKKGARVLAGGKRKGLYIQPTVLLDVDNRMRVAREETFGPVVVIMKFRTFDEAIKMANNTEYGLDASVFTQDVNKAVKAASLIEAGAVTINGAPSHGLGNFPFGGEKDSGMGREGMNYTIEEMTKHHTIVFTHLK
jgi:glyceraldehyde-3-phosphate dehydrogenase (NADP+)